MSKNCELFINLCNFMKYLLNEILSEQDATDSVKDATQDIFSAIIAYSKKVNYELKPVFNYDPSVGNDPLKVCLEPKRNAELISTLIPAKKTIRKDKYLQVTRLPSISYIEKESVRHNFQNDGLIWSFHPGRDQSKTSPTSQFKLEESGIHSLQNNVNTFLTDLEKIDVVKKVTKGCLDKVPCTNIDIAPESDEHQIIKKDITMDNRLLGTNKNCDLNIDKNFSRKEQMLDPDNSKVKSCEDLNKFAENLQSGHSSKRPFHKDNVNNTSIDNGNILTQNNTYPKSNQISNNLKERVMPTTKELNVICSEENFEIFFEENFLQFYFFSDIKFESTSSSATKCDNSVESNCDNAGKQTDEKLFFDKLLTLKISQKEFLLKYPPDIIPHSFQALNGCLVSKLIKKGFFCWKCHNSCDTYHDLQSHLKRWEVHGLPFKDDNRTLFCLCIYCNFFVIAPDIKINELKEFHDQYHKKRFEKLLPLEEANSEHEDRDGILAFSNVSFDFELYVNNMLRDKILRERRSHTYSFLGICLICMTSFLSPLEWSYHIYEYSHLRQPDERYLTCTPCCLVILGKRDQNIEKLISLKRHMGHCINTLGSEDSSHWDIDIR